MQKIQADYLRNSFRMEEYTEFNIGEMRGGYRADEDGITLWKGNYLTREAESRLSWEEARFLVQFLYGGRSISSSRRNRRAD